MAIDPTIDCVFKAILGDPEHDGILINFLNAILGFKDEQQVKSVTIENPFNPKSFQADKLSILDIKAQDQNGRFFQVEVQLANYQSLHNRMIHNWSKMLGSVLKEGEDFKQLRPVFSIWLLPSNFFKEATGCHLAFQIYDWEQQLDLLGYPPIHLLQLKNWHEGATLDNDKQRWLKLFKDGKNLDLNNLPEWMATPIMKQVGKIMSLFEKTGPLYREYVTREQAVRQHLTLLTERDDAEKLLETALAEKEQAVNEKEQAVKQNLILLEEREDAQKLLEITVSEKEQAVEQNLTLLEEREDAQRLLKAAVAEGRQKQAEQEVLLRFLREKGFDPSEALASAQPEEPPSD